MRPIIRKQKKDFYNQARAQLAADDNPFAFSFTGRNIIEFQFREPGHVPLTRETASLPFVRFVTELRRMTGVDFRLHAWDIGYRGKSSERTAYIALKAKSPLNYLNQDFRDVLDTTQLGHEKTKGEELEEQFGVTETLSRFPPRPKRDASVKAAAFVA